MPLVSVIMLSTWSRAGKQRKFYTYHGNQWEYNISLVYKNNTENHVSESWYRQKWFFHQLIFRLHRWYRNRHFQCRLSYLSFIMPFSLNQSWICSAILQILIPMLGLNGLMSYLKQRNTLFAHVLTMKDSYPQISFLSRNTFIYTKSCYLLGIWEIAIKE